MPVKKQKTTRSSSARKSVTKSKVRKPAVRSASSRATTKRATKKHPIHKRVYHAIRHRVRKNGFIKTVAIPVIAVVSFAGIGAYLLFFRHAATQSHLAQTCQNTDKECRWISKQGQINRIYEAVMNRQADKGGLDYWTGYYTSARTIQDVGGALFNAAGAEGTAAKNATKEQFVDLLYTNVAGRAADAGGKSFWVGQLGDGSIAKKVEIIMSFTDQTESRGKIFDSSIAFLNTNYPYTAPAVATAPSPTSPTNTTSTTPSNSPSSAGGSTGTSSSTPTTGGGTTTPSNTSTAAQGFEPAEGQHSSASCNGNTACMFTSREGKILRAYYAFQGSYDVPGFKYWLEQFTTKMGDKQSVLAGSIINVIPAVRDASADQFVTMLYKKTLEREPDAGGLAYWKGILAQQGKATTMFTFTNFPDVKAKTNYQGSGKTFQDFIISQIDKLYADVATRQQIAVAQSQATIVRYQQNDDSKNPQTTAVAPYPATKCQNNIDCMYNSREGKIVRLYYVMFGSIDTDGFKFWVQQLASSQYNENYNYLFQKIKATDARIKDLDSKKLTLLAYRQALERTPDSGGMFYWNNRFSAAGDGGSGQLLLDFTSIPDVALHANYQNSGYTFREVVTKRVHELYAAVGNQIPQVATLSTATNPQASNTQPYSAVSCNANADCMYNSREGQVVRAYMWMTNRAPDSGSIVYWNNYYTGTYTGQNSLKKMAEALLSTPTEQRLKDLSGISEENVVKDYYAFMAGRTADAGGLQSWLAQVKANGRALTAISFSGTDEVKNARNVPVLANSGKTYKDRVVDLVHQAYAEKGAQFVTTYTPPPPPVTSYRSTDNGSGSTSGAGGSGAVSATCNGVNFSSTSSIKACQRYLGVAVDGLWGNQSECAYQRMFRQHSAPGHTCYGSSGGGSSNPPIVCSSSVCNPNAPPIHTSSPPVCSSSVCGGYGAPSPSNQSASCYIDWVTYNRNDIRVASGRDPKGSRTRADCYNQSTGSGNVRVTKWNGTTIRTVDLTGNHH